MPIFEHNVRPSFRSQMTQPSVQARHAGSPACIDGSVGGFAFGGNSGRLSTGRVVSGGQFGAHEEAGADGDGVSTARETPFIAVKIKSTTAAPAKSDLARLRTHFSRETQGMARSGNGYARQL
jgi:hypothetical protein